MCHAIYPRKGKHERESFGFFENYLIGSKIFHFHHSRQIISPYYLHKFKFNATPVGLCCKEEPVKQEVVFQMPVRVNGTDDNVFVRPNLLAGMHISPLFDSSGNMQNYTNIEVSPHQNISLHIPVFFTKESIVFYDGHDISVDCFYIINPVLFREWLISIHLDMKWDTTYLSDFKTWYKSIYKWIEKSKCFQQDEDGKG